MGDDEFDPSTPYWRCKRDLIEAAEPLLNEEILQGQETDGFCNFIRSLIECGATSAYKEEAYSGLVIRTLHRPRQIVLLKILRPRVLNLYHQSITAVHPRKEMYMTICQTYYWPRMAPQCYACVRQCWECARGCVKIRRHTKELQLFSTTALRRRWYWTGWVFPLQEATIPTLWSLLIGSVSLKGPFRCDGHRNSNLPMLSRSSGPLFMAHRRQ